jgi:hypothetical protein
MSTRSKGALPNRTPITVAVLAAAFAAPTLAQVEGFFAGLKSHSEVPVRSTTGLGSFQATLMSPTALSYTLTYINLEGQAQQSHIHVGSAWDNGGISVFLCTNIAGGSASTPACPSSGGTVTGTLTSSDVLGPTDQGIAAGEFDELLRAMRDGAAYVNVHSDLFPAGEIRGQIISGP